MTIEFTTTLQPAPSAVKMLIHGPYGAGKTRLLATTGDLPGTLIISCEGGLLSLRDVEIAVYDVTDTGANETALDRLRAIYSFLRSGEHEFRWICLDTISEIAEVALNIEKRQTKDGRRAYGEMYDVVTGLVRSFRDLPYHVVMTCKQAREEINGTILMAPSMPGRALSSNVGYLFDEVFALRVEVGDDGEVRRALQTQRDVEYEAKDRSGALRMFEPPSLAVIYHRISGQKPGVNNDGKTE